MDREQERLGHFKAMVLNVITTILVAWFFHWWPLIPLLMAVQSGWKWWQMYSH